MPPKCLILLFLATLPVLTPAFAQDQIPIYEAADLDDSAVSLEDYRGRVLMLNIWATWCEPCREELPYIQSLHQQYSSDGLHVVGSSIDTPGSTKLVSEHADTMGLTYTVWRDADNKATFALRMIGVPETVLLDTQGRIIHHWRGPIEPGTGVEQIIEDALGISDGATPLESASDNIFSVSLPVGLAIAFSAGLLSFLSPCVLPLVPAYVAFITGTSAKEADRTIDAGGQMQKKLHLRQTALTRGSMFILGFSAVFISLGIVISYVSSLLDAALWIERIGGIVVIVFGLHLLGLLKIKRLYQQRSLNASRRFTGPLGALMVGMGFGAGWTPCIGPILAGILVVAAASSSVGMGVILLSVYSAGLAVPFIVSAIAIDRFVALFSRIKRRMQWIEKTSGVLLVGIGVLLLTGSFSALAELFSGILTASPLLGDN